MTVTQVQSQGRTEQTLRRNQNKVNFQIPNWAFNVILLFNYFKPEHEPVPDVAWAEEGDCSSVGNTRTALELLTSGW